MKKIAVNIATRDRPTELSLLLQSLRTQTVQDFDVFILEDCSGTPLFNYHFLVCLINKLKDEGHIVDIERTPFNYGVSKSRQALVDKSKQYELILRADDDVILESDYIERLLSVLDAGYDLASGVTPFIGQPQVKRETRFIHPVGNKVVFDKDGNFVYNGDDCGMQYYDDTILPLHHFRSCALYKTKIHDVIDYKSSLSKHGFREEQIFSFKMILAGFKLGMSSQAVAWHLLTPSGGERFSNQGDLIRLNQQIFEEWTTKTFKEHGDFIKKYNDLLSIVVDKPSDVECMKESNLAKVRV